MHASAHGPPFKTLQNRFYDSDASAHGPPACFIALLVVTADGAARGTGWYHRTGSWAVADVDAAGQEGEQILEFMGYPWAVWQPHVKVKSPI